MARSVINRSAMQRSGEMHGTRGVTYRFEAALIPGATERVEIEDAIMEEEHSRYDESPNTLLPSVIYERRGRDTGFWWDRTPTEKDWGPEERGCGKGYPEGRSSRSLVSSLYSKICFLFCLSDEEFYHTYAQGCKRE